MSRDHGSHLERKLEIEKAVHGNDLEFSTAAPFLSVCLSHGRTPLKRVPIRVSSWERRLLSRVNLSIAMLLLLLLLPEPNRPTDGRTD